LESSETVVGGSAFACAGLALCRAAAGPFGSEFRSTTPGRPFASNAHAGAGNGTVSAFNVASDGTPFPIIGSRFADTRQRGVG
jgi:hypothetical protein